MTLTPVRLLRAYLCVLLCFMALDACWLTWMGPRLYRPALATLMADDVDVVAAAMFYAIYILGLCAFAVVPALERRRPVAALRLGALFGCTAYATYDLTNQATLRDWPWAITCADLAWGTIASGVSAYATAAFTCRRGRRTGGR